MSTISDPATHPAAGYAANNLTVTDQERTIVTDFSLHLEPGTWINLSGPSISDASIVLATLAGRRPRDGGVLQLDGRHLPAAPTPGQVGYVGRNHPLLATLTAAETVMAALIAAGLRQPAELRQQAEQQLEALALPTGVWHNLTEQLSGGQQQRVALAVALAPKPRLLALDDPTSELDPDTAELVANLVHEAVNQGACGLTQTRDPVLLSFCSSVAQL